jgi:hypothetical protein
MTLAAAQPMPMRLDSSIPLLTCRTAVWIASMLLARPRDRAVRPSAVTK